MANGDLLNAFNDCIERLAHGETINDCLYRYPQHSSTLGPMLQTVLLVKQATVSSAEAEHAKNRMRERVAVAAIQRLRPQSPRITFYRQFRLAMAGVLIFTVVGLLGLTVAAQDALPGDSLYSVKRLREDVWLALPGKQESLQQQFSRQRVEEIKSLLDQGRSVDVEFEGELEAIDGSTWRVSGLPVITDASTGFPSDDVHIGEQVKVMGFTTARRELVATEIRRVRVESNDATPTPPPPTPITVTPTATRLAPTPSPTLDETNGLVLPPSGCAVTPMGEMSVIIRDGGSPAHTVIGELEKGRYLPIIGFNPANETWYAVRLSDGRTGWLSSTDSQLVNSCINLAILTYPPIIMTPPSTSPVTRVPQISNTVQPASTSLPNTLPPTAPTNDDNDNVNNNDDDDNDNENNSGSNSGPGSGNDDDNDNVP